MLDFPSPATTNQLYSSAGKTWQYDGTKWVVSTATAFPDAPPDGHTYGRQNAAWTNVDTPIATATQMAQDNVGRNLLANPVFAVAQRGTGPWTASGYTADRWNLGVATDTVSIGLSVMSDAQRAVIGDESATYCLSNTFTGNAASGASHFIEQRVENVRRLSNRTVTVSFWAVASAAQKLGISALQFFGSGGSPSSPVTINGVAVQLAGGWARYSVAISLPSISGMTLGTAGDYTTFRFWYSSGATNNTQAGGIGVQSGTIQLWGIQLELGSVATALDKGGSPQAQLAECQRFYVVLNTVGMNVYTSATGVGWFSPVTLPVLMRATPTIGLSGQTVSNATVATPSNVTANGFSFGITTTATGGAWGTATVSASADL